MTIWPNPASGVVTLKGYLRGEKSIVTIFDVQGRVLQRLSVQPASGGYYETTWDGKTQSGGVVGSGVYYAVLAEEGKSSAGKAIRIVLLR